MGFALQRSSPLPFLSGTPGWVAFSGSLKQCGSNVKNMETSASTYILSIDLTFSSIGAKYFYVSCLVTNFSKFSDLKTTLPLFFQCVDQVSGQPLGASLMFAPSWC